MMVETKKPPQTIRDLTDQANDIPSARLRDNLLDSVIALQAALTGDADDRELARAVITNLLISHRTLVEVLHVCMRGDEPVE